MTCKHMTKKHLRMSKLVGDELLLPNPGVLVPACQLDRPVDRFARGGSNCEKILPEGPCWLWPKLHGSEPDPAF
jgi:hypothetical protein